MNLKFPTSTDGTGRQENQHTCFKSCKDYIYDDYKYIYTFDNRPNCTNTKEDLGFAFVDQYLLCLPENYTCEQTHLAEEIKLAGGLSIAAVRGLIAVLIASPLQFLFELLAIYLIKMKVSGQKPDENCQLLSIQIFMSLIYFMLLAFTIGEIYQVFAFGRPNLILSTFFYALLVD